MDTILQSPAWAAFQRDLGHRVHQVEGPGWSFLAIVEQRRVGRYLYCPYGPLAEGPEALGAALSRLADVARAERAWFVRVEPTMPGTDLAAIAARGPGPFRAVLRRCGFHEGARNVQPLRTRAVDLRQDREAILGAMTGTNRTLYRNAHKKGLSIEASQDPGDVDVLIGFMDAVARRKDFRRHPDGYLRQAARTLMPLDSATLYLARHHGEPVAAALVYDSPTTRTYAHAAMPFRHRQLRPNQPMIVQALLDAKERGQAVGDLFGIAPTEDPEHPWAGFTAFKRSFGGTDITHPGTWERPVRRAAHAGYRAAQQARDLAARARTRSAR